MRDGPTAHLSAVCPLTQGTGVRDSAGTDRDHPRVSTDAEATQVIDQPASTDDVVDLDFDPDSDTDVLSAVGAPDAAVSGDGAEPGPRRGIPGVLDRWGRTRVALVSAAGLLLALAALYLVDLATTSGEIERNTTIAGVEVGGMTPEQALAALNQQVVPSYTQPVTVDAHGIDVTVDPAVAGLTPDPAGSVAAAGTRSANPLVRLTSFFTSTDLPLGVHVDRAELEPFVAAVAAATPTWPPSRGRCGSMAPR